MFGVRTVAYRTLPQDEHGVISSGGEKGGRRLYRRSHIVFWCALEAFVLLSGFVLYELWRKPAMPVQVTQVADEYAELNTYNTTMVFTENWEFMQDTPEAELFWDEVLGNHGIVSVPTDWALSRGFSETQPHPDKPGQSVYQVDVFHSLHCLYRIRTLLVSNDTSNLWPANKEQKHDKIDNHTLHCVDFIRQQLICHADVLLQGTDDFLHYSKSSGHQCRDYSAIMKWVDKNLWMEHHTWLFEHVDVGAH